jgi:putative ABC transport system permease protein
MLIDLFIYSLRNLGNRKLRTWLTLTGIVIGIASVIALIGLGGGLRMAILGQFGGVSADILTIQAGGVAFSGPPGTGVVNPLSEDYIDGIKRISFVDTAISRIIEGSMMEFNRIQQVAFAASIPDGEDRRIVEEIAGVKISKGRLLKDGDLNKVVIGHNFNKQDNGFEKLIDVGDKITLNGQKFDVVGVLESAGSFFIDGALLINEKPLRDLVDNSDDVDLIAVRVKKMDDVDNAKDAIERYLRKERGVKEGEEDFSVSSAQATIDTINNILGGVQAFVIIIAAISMIVGAIGIINTMFTAVLERRSEIGIMKSIGAKNSDIFLLFFIESGLLGAVGGIIGTLFGWLAALLGTSAINNLLNISVSPDISVVLVISSILGSFLLGAVSGIIPAMQAASMSPVDALRK